MADGVTIIDTFDTIEVIGGGVYSMKAGLDIIETAAQGMPGRDGEAGGQVQITVPVSVSALRPIKRDGSYCTSDLSDMGKLLGITMTAGLNPKIVTSGYMTDLGWNWTTGAPIYVSASGTLTQTAPSTGYIQQVASAASSTEIIVVQQEPIRIV